MELLRMTAAIVCGNLISLLLLGVLYSNYVLLGKYLEPILWATLIGEALHSSSAGIATFLSRCSAPSHRSLVVVALELIWKGLRKDTKNGGNLGLRALFGLALFSLASLLILLSHIVSWAGIATYMLVIALPVVLVLFLLDRKIFIYRRVISDGALSSLVVMFVFFACSSFIFFFLGTESLLEGLTVVDRASSWVQVTLDDHDVKATLSSHLGHGADLIKDTVASLEAEYNNTMWWGPVKEMAQNYIEHGTIMTGGGNNSTGVISATDSLPEAMVPLMGSGQASPSAAFAMLKDALKDWDIHVSFSGVLKAMTHATRGGHLTMKLFGTTVQSLLMGLGLGFSIGFKTILFFTIVWYMLRTESLVKRISQDFFPMSSQEQKDEAVKVLRQSIEGVFFCIPTIACFHGVITLSSFTLIGVEFPFFATFLSVLLSVLPIMDPSYVFMPWAIALGSSGDYPRALLLVLCNVCLSSSVARQVVNTSVLGPSSAFMTYLTVLSIFMGFTVFGVQGVFAGPLVLVLGNLIYRGLDYIADVLATQNQEAPGGTASLESSKAGFSRGESLRRGSSSKWRGLLEHLSSSSSLPVPEMDAEPGSPDNKVAEQRRPKVKDGRPPRPVG
ncbi:unnamed protein product [Chrysoparadoxa australica]